MAQHVADAMWDDSMDPVRVEISRSGDEDERRVLVQFLEEDAEVNDSVEVGRILLDVDDAEGLRDGLTKAIEEAS